MIRNLRLVSGSAVRSPHGPAWRDVPAPSPAAAPSPPRWHRGPAEPSAVGRVPRAVLRLQRRDRMWRHRELRRGAPGTTCRTAPQGCSGDGQHCARPGSATGTRPAQTGHGSLGDRPSGTGGSGGRCREQRRHRGLGGRQELPRGHGGRFLLGVTQCGGCRSLPAVRPEPREGPEPWEGLECAREPRGETGACQEPRAGSSAALPHRHGRDVRRGAGEGCRGAAGRGRAGLGCAMGLAMAVPWVWLCQCHGSGYSAAVGLAMLLL